MTTQQRDLGRPDAASGPDVSGERPVAPRLLALRLQGFKSFAERTNVEFGGGISAVVGPNGSGKSNLADALRWALGEQGRALRSRKAEDVIWAGSEKRAAQGMADVTLVLDNGDGLLPVDFQVLELGRRLYRSGENEYLLNKQRIRLRDLVDLLDGAHLADNAFLFIGQGMVDQALALRPEERRPLFEEVAGVRRHERRRRKAEQQLIESDANLARVDDILAELRPQARRLGAQAEQQATRSSVGDELTAALLASTHVRWHEAATRLTAATERSVRARSEADQAMADLEVAEAAAAALAADLSTRASLERERRDAHEARRATLTDLRLRDGRLASDLEATDRDRRRVAEERSAAEAEAVAQRRTVAAPVPARDLELEAAVTEADRELAAALAELAALRTASTARGEELAAVRRAEAARQADAETARRRLAEAERRAAEEAAAMADLDARQAIAVASLEATRRALEFAVAAELTAHAAAETARVALERAEAERVGATDRAAELSAGVAALRGRRDALTERLAEDERRPIARAARKVGGRRLDEDLVVDPDLRAAVQAALADRARAYLVGSTDVAQLAGERGGLIVADRLTVDPGSDASGPFAADEVAVRHLLDAVAAAGGGRLGDAIRRDGTGATRRILGRAVWTPDLATCLSVQELLPSGWISVVRDGSAVVDDVGVSLGAGDALLERRAEHDRLSADAVAAETALEVAQAAVAEATQAASTARATVESARAEEGRLAGERRRVEETERANAREAEAIAREVAWHAAQRARLDAELARSREAVQASDADADADTADAGNSDTGNVDMGDALRTWEARAAELRERRDRLAARLATHDAGRRDAEHQRARAEAAVVMANERMGRADREAAAILEQETARIAERDQLRAAVAMAAEAEEHAREALIALHAADAADRTRLSEAERMASGARERVRAADDRSRVADHAELEARLGLESLREGVLVELASLGEFAWAGLGIQPPTGDRRSPDIVASGSDTPSDAIDGLDPDGDESVAEDTAALEAALATLAERWSVDAPAETPPAPGRLAQLRRRYHELGAANPFAVEEYAELKARLEALEAQGADLRAAITRTRELISELDDMIADQFRTTFAALETAFERRFEQLFGGGYARLSLTDPHDLGSTGVEIVARPPGKKAQALAMLSGGERALTAVALLFAMLEVRPVPFCVLDEVDAALDEANIGRFADALRSLAHQTQFIVITHNRGTIEAADALYGVTVGDDSVSRVISLRLDEAQAIAAERGLGLGVAG
jgi:chromosome segregation protein